MVKKAGMVMAGVLALLFAQLFTVAAARADITMGISDWPGWVAWYVAQHNGYLKKYAPDVRLVWFPSYMTSVEALSAGRIDANCQALIDTLAPVAKHVPVKVVLVTDNSAGNDALMVANQIKSFSALKGKTIAVEMNSIEEYLDATALARHGMSTRDVHFVNMSTGDAAAALMTGRVAAAGVWNPWIQRIEARHAGHPIFTSAKAPGLIPDVVVVRDDVIAHDRKELIGLAKAWFATVRFIHRHPAAAAAIMAPHVDLPAHAYAESLAGTRLFGAKLNSEALAPGSSPVSLYNSTAATGVFLKQVHMLAHVPDGHRFIDGTLVAAARH